MGNYRKFILKIVLDTLSHLSLVLAQWYIYTYVSTTGSITNRGHDRLLFLNPFMVIWNNCFLSRQLNYKNWSQNIFLNFYQWPDVIQINIGLLIQNSAVQLVLYFWHASFTPEGNGDCCERRGAHMIFKGNGERISCREQRIKGELYWKLTPS